METLTPEMIEAISAGAAVLGVVALAFVCAAIPIVVLTIVSAWKVHVKAGRPGWSAIIPIYNFYVLLEIVGRPTWWLILLFIPLVNVVVMFLVSIELAQCFGKGAGVGVLIALFPVIGLSILAFSDAIYTPPATAVA